MELVFGNALLLIFVIIELVILYLDKKEPIPWQEVVTNLNSGHILLWVFRGLEVAAYYLVLKGFSIDVFGSLPYWLTWAIAFIIWDFCFYWMHRIHHYFRVLWGVHSVHHEGEHFSLSLGIRNSWYSALTGFPFFIIMAMIGIPVDIFVAVSSINYFIQFYNHNHLVNKSSFLEYFMVTPSHHRVHHGKNKPYFNKNYSGTFIIWDKLFGTFQEELADNPVIFGINNVPIVHNPILINNSPFVRLFLKHKASFQKMMTSSIQVSNFLLISGALLSFILLLFYIYYETEFRDYRSIVIFAMVFLSTIGSGLMSDGHRLGIFVWFGSMVLIPIYLITIMSQMTLFKLVLIIAIVHGVIVLIESINNINESRNRNLA
jgi:sterol desaturase/sphingolipid hydroxylase (fatty acid hydroxylase superfamily)